VESFQRKDLVDLFIINGAQPGTAGNLLFP